MFLHKRVFPSTVLAILAIGLFSTSVIAQSGEVRQRQVAEAIKTINLDNRSVPQNEPVDSPAVENLKATRIVTGNSLLTSTRIDRLLSLAIDERLGARYSWGATGPFAFDCSGFVWSAFRSVGVNFERGSARTLWVRFLPADPEDEFDFGNLVFFSGLTHVGIVADEHGFYHSSRQHGVIYSRFSDYWLSRIDGFRRVPGLELTQGE